MKTDPKYSNKYFVWQQALSPFVIILCCLVEILYLPTPYFVPRWADWSNWLRIILRKQSAKHKRLFALKNQNPTPPTVEIGGVNERI